jgi:hypothetical protein
MKQMPALLKWIMGVMLFQVLRQLGWIGSAFAHSTSALSGDMGRVLAPRLLSIVITIGVLMGLRSGSRIALHLGRILNAIGLAIAGLMLFVALVAQFNHINVWGVYGELCVGVCETAFVFFGLGSKHVRSFCGFPGACGVTCAGEGRTVR